jgi:hypothetical protein
MAVGRLRQKVVELCVMSSDGTGLGCVTGYLHNSVPGQSRDLSLVVTFKKGF